MSEPYPNFVARDTMLRGAARLARGQGQPGTERCGPRSVLRYRGKLQTGTSTLRPRPASPAPLAADSGRPDVGVLTGPPMKTNSPAPSRFSLPAAAPTRCRRVVIVVAGLAGLLAVGCKQGAGERCQVASDCADGLTCQAGCLNPAAGAMCECTAIASSTGSGGSTVPPGSSGGAQGTAGMSGTAGVSGTGGTTGAAGESGAEGGAAGTASGGAAGGGGAGGGAGGGGVAGTAGGGAGGGTAGAGGGA